jgi:hypothetical protein
MTSNIQPTLHTWKDALSGGVWARLNHLPYNGSILDSAQAQARFGIPASNPTSTSDPPSPFTNNFRVTGNSSLFPFEDEPSIAVRNQTSQFLMVVGANSLSTGQMVSYISADQGNHWSNPTLLPFSRGNDSFASDPTLGVDRAGTFYYSFLSLASTVSGVTNDDVVVATSTDGVAWTDHVAVHRKIFGPPSTILSEFYDKEYLAVGPNKLNPALDAIYVTYTDFVSFCSPLFTNCSMNSTIMEVHSLDSGSTWSSPAKASPTETSPENSTAPHIVTGSMPAVASTGDMYVAYFDTGTGGFLNSSASIMIAKSTTNGITFQAATQAASIPQQLTFASQGSSCCFRWWSSMFPSMDIASDGTIYIAFGARQSKYSADPADVYLISSSNQGTSWSLPNMVNDQSSQNGHFFAWIKTSSDNVVHIIWGDQRLDPTGIGYDIFYATATNHGATIGPNIRVTDVGSDPLETIGFIGDYFNLAISGNQAYPVWTDGRRAVRPLGRETLVGETDIYTARLGPRDTPAVALQGSAIAGYQGPVHLAGTGLPRESYFVVRVGGVQVISQTHLIQFFFSAKSGNLSDMILPVSNYYGAYNVQLADWVSGNPIANTTLYVVDTRNIQVSISGPSSASPGDTVKWTIQLISQSNSSSTPGYTSTFTISQALLTLPNGSVQDLTANMKTISTGTFAVSTDLPPNASTGTYTLSVNASQTGALIQDNGVGTSTLTVASQPQNVANLVSSEQMYTLIVGLIAAAVLVLQVIQLTRRRSGLPVNPSGQPTIA